MQFLKCIYGSNRILSIYVRFYMPIRHLLNPLMLLVIYLTVLSDQLACAASSSSLTLSPGLQIKLLDSYTESKNGFIPIQTKPYTLAVPAYGNGFFIPILSSTNFNSTTSSSSGYSFGFLFSPRNGDHRNPSDIYLSVCTGKLGRLNITSLDQALYGEDDDKNLPIRPYYTFDGIVLPVSIFNLGNPLTSFKDLSLTVDDTSDNLQLWNSGTNTITWTVSSAAMMNITDDGDFQILDSTNKISFQSSDQITDTLLPNGKLSYQGKSLVSNDSNFVLKMELGGLALYLKTPEGDLAYWNVPVINNADVMKPPCEGRSSFAQWDVSSSSSSSLDMMAGPCGNTTYKTQIFAPNELSADLLKLENDGRVYFYSIDTGSGSLIRSDSGLDSETIFTIAIERPSDVDAKTVIIGNLTYYSGASQNLTIRSHTRIPLYSQWGTCDSPIACGGLSICTPHVRSSDICRCPPDPPDLKEKPTFIRQKSKGCKRSVQLSCDQNSTFVAVNKTSSISLLSGWMNFPNISLDECKQQCSDRNCSCTGVVYDLRRSFCLHITDDLTLLNVSDDGTSNPSGILGDDFITFIRISQDKPNSSWWSSNFRVVIGIGIPVFCILCVIVGLLSFILLKRTNRWSPTIEEDESELADILPLLPSRFSYQDLHQATQGFSSVLGKGGCGSVYGGILPDGRKVAVKKLEFTSTTTNSRSFLAEVATMGRTNHQNVVRLTGFCWEHSNRLLVYDFVEKGSLDQWLFQDEKHGTLDWSTRYKIALGISRGLKYLHDDCAQPILHLDIKPQNILLDNAFVVKLADFGMSRLMDRDISYVVTQVRGTPGYIAPEWHLHGGVSKKCDVYSMGMVMLEIVAGRRNVDLSLLDTEVCEQWHLSSWAVRLCEEGKIMELLDKHFDIKSVNQAEVCRLIKTALWCIQEDPIIRPQISTVVQWLEGKIEIEDPPLSSVSQVKKATAKPPILSITSSSSATGMFTSSSASGY